MANTIQIKRGTGTSALTAGELGFNTSTNTLYIGTSTGTNIAIGGEGAFLPLNGGTINGQLTVTETTVFLDKIAVSTSIYMGTVEDSASRLYQHPSYGYLDIQVVNSEGQVRSLRINNHNSNSNNLKGLEYIVSESSGTSYHMVYTDYSIVYSTSQPLNPTAGMIWLEP